MDVSSGTSVPAFVGVSKGTVSVGASLHETCLVGKAGPDVVGETGGGRPFMPADKREHVTVWGPGQR